MFAKRPKPDWVYRSSVRDEAGALSDALGSYEVASASLVSGNSNAQVRILYDSHNFMRGIVRGQGANVVGSVLPPARSEGRRAFIHRVQGVVFIRPSAWALGSFYQLGIRFGIFEQDPIVGGILVDPLYSMWLVSTSDFGQPAQWANDRKWTRELRTQVEFNDNSQRRAFPFNFSVRRSLNPNECYAAYMETATGSVTIVPQWWLRTLVSDEQ